MLEGCDKVERTKKEHYVPQCYLKNFRIPRTEGRINVFDKKKAEIRTNQNILDNASERYFYDIDIDKILNEATEENRNKMLNRLGEKYEIFRNDKTQHLEKFFSEVIEGDYSEVLKSIISKAENATPWYLDNCYSLSIKEKVVLSICITMQFLRTKKQRVMLEEGMTKLYETFLVKLYNIEYGEYAESLSPGDIKANIGKEAMKMKHAKFILDFNKVLEFSGVLRSHLWVTYINRTPIPFWTSDAPIALNPMSNGGRCGKGIGAKGIEILLPISDKVTLAMYDREEYEKYMSLGGNVKDRLYIEIYDENHINSFNALQLKECYRCVFSGSEDFSLAKEMCEKNPSLMQEKEYFTVG